MSVDWFIKLKEIDSLTKMKTSHLKAKAEQEERIKKLSDRKEENLLQTAKLKQSLFAINSEMADVEKKLKVASEQKQRVLDMGADEKKVAQYNAEIEALEEKGFEFLTKLEETETELNDSKTFLSGLEKTIKEIEVEGQAETSIINNELANIELRTNLLLEDLPQNFKDRLTKTTAKNLAHGPFTRVEQGSCYFCRYKLSRLDESEIDMQKSLKVCNQCGRIFLPYGS